MLINFRVANFTSYDVPTTFTMESGKARGKREHIHTTSSAKILKFSAIYGANAAGKSNLIRAIDFARDIILDIPGARLPLAYNRTSAENKERPTLFEFEILVGGRKYTYGFEIFLARHEFCSEWLCDTTKSKHIVIYERHINAPEQSELHIKTSSDFLARLNIYWEDVLNDSNTLFLREMNTKKADIYSQKEAPSFLQDIYTWFQNQLCVIYPNQHQLSPLPNFITGNWSELSQYLKDFDIDITKSDFAEISEDRFFRSLSSEEREKFRKHLEDLLIQARRDFEDKNKGLLLNFGADLYSLQLEETTEGEDPKLKIKMLELEHSSNLRLALSEESDGTRRILELIKILLTKDTTFIVDEIDRSMHPRLTLAFVNSFLRKIAERNVQLIVTTHEPRLLDLQNLRRDEIWFVDKQEGISMFSRLDSFGSKGSSAFRGDIKIETAYMNGRFRGVPQTRSIE